MQFIRKIDEPSLTNQNNNFTFVRLFLASSVIFSHAYWRVSGKEGVDGLSLVLGKPVSAFAVDGFFFMSGFLIYASSLRRNKVPAFLLARLTRLWPALAVSVIVTVAIGVAVTEVPWGAYIRGETARFVVRNLLLQGGAYRLTGVMCADTACNVNGSLWTIAWEVRCYLALAGLMALRLSGARTIGYLIAPASVAFCVFWSLGHHPEGGWFYFGNMMARLWTLFALGMAAFVFRSQIRLSWLIFAGMSVFVLGVHGVSGPFASVLEYVLTGYGVLCIGFLTTTTKAFSSTWPDLSYGVYIYAFPIMMVVAEFSMFSNPLSLAFMTLLATFPVAAASWYLIEKPALAGLRQWERLRRA